MPAKPLPVWACSCALTANFSEPWVLRKEHATGYWENKAATGLKVDSVSRPKALECLATLGFDDVAGGWDAVLLKPEKSMAAVRFLSETSCVHI